MALSRDDLRVIADWQEPAVADDHLRVALAQAANMIQRDGRRLAEIREEDLRTAVFDALVRQLPALVHKERCLELAAFRGVGGFDVLVDRAQGGGIAWLAR
jgi:hypothetical protein